MAKKAGERGDEKLQVGNRQKGKGSRSASENKDGRVVATETGRASVPEVERAATKSAEAARGGPSRYSMVSVPSRRGSGLDVALL